MGDEIYFKETWSMDDDGNFLYRADGDRAANRWNKVLNMPPQAARCFARITKVKVERLHDMTMADARKMGAPADLEEDRIGIWWNKHLSGQAMNEGASWRHNPWVWVITIKNIKAPKGDAGGEREAAESEERQELLRPARPAERRSGGGGHGGGMRHRPGPPRQVLLEMTRKARKEPGYRYTVEIRPLYLENEQPGREPWPKSQLKEGMPDCQKNIRSEIAPENDAFTARRTGSACTGRLWPMQAGHAGKDVHQAELRLYPRGQ